MNANGDGEAAAAGTRNASATRPRQMATLTPTPATEAPRTPATTFNEAAGPEKTPNAQLNSSDVDRDEMEYQETANEDCMVLRSTEATGGPHGRQDDDGDWQTVLTVRQKKALARAGKKATFSEGGYESSGPSFKPPVQPANKKKFKTRRLPPLPKDDIKVIVRPHQGLPIRELTAPQIAEAVINACQGKVNGNQFLLRLKPGSNIFIISTPTEEVANIARRITGLTLNGRLHAVSAYAAVGEDTKKGVIHGIAPHTSPETLLANLRLRTQGVDILRARMLGETKTAVITFFGPIVPRYVYYMGGELPCFPYKNTIQFCKTCKQTGHRTDVCPNPHLPVCHNCGTREPQPDHDCNPVCATCGEKHLTGSKECKRRFKLPPQRPQPKSPNRMAVKTPGKAIKSSSPKRRWSDTDDTDDDDWPPLRTQGDIPTSQPQIRKSRSQERQKNPDQGLSDHSASRHHRMSSRSPTPSRTSVATGDSTQHKVSWAGMAQKGAPITANPEYQRIVSENRQLKKTVEELKIEMATLKAQFQNTKIGQAKPAQGDKPAAQQTTISNIERMMNQVVEQIQALQTFQQQLFAEVQNHKVYVDEQISKLQQTSRKRASSNPGTPTARKVKNGAVSDSTDTEIVANHGQ